MAQLANGTLHLAGMDQAATRAALSDAQQILQDLMLRLDERLFQEVSVSLCQLCAKVFHEAAMTCSPDTDGKVEGLT